MKTTKAEIIDKAIGLFKERGYDAVRVDDICAACCITSGSFYHHFKAKGDVLLEYFTVVMNNSEDIMRRMMFAEDDREKIWAILEVSIDIALDMGKDLIAQLWHLYLFKGNKPFSPFLASNYMNNSYDFAPRGVYSAMVILMERAQKKGLVRTDLAAFDLLTFLCAAFIGLSVDWASSDEDYDVKQKMREAFDAIICSH